MLHTIGSESEGRDKVLRRERNSVGAITVVRRVEDERDIISELCTSRMMQESVAPRRGWPPLIERGSGVGEGRSLTDEEVESVDFRLGRIPSRRMI